MMGNGKGNQDQKDANIVELNGKLLKTTNELNDLKLNYTMKCKELEQC